MEIYEHIKFDLKGQIYQNRLIKIQSKINSEFCFKMSALLVICCLIALLFSLNNADHFPPKALTCPEEKMEGDKPWCLPGYYDYLKPPMKEDEKMELDFIFTIEEIRDVDDERETIQIEIYSESY